MPAPAAIPAAADPFRHLTLWPATGARFGPVSRSEHSPPGDARAPALHGETSLPAKE